MGVMTKWILALLALAAIGFFVWSQRNSTKTAYVNGLPAYNTLPGREYIFERDCYIFKFKRRDTTFPLVGANAPDLAISVPELPADVTPANLGRDFPDVRILDLVRTGDRVRLVSVRRDESHGHATITYELLFTDEAQRRYPRIDAFYLLDHSPEAQGAAPHLLEGYLVERVKK